MDFFDAMQQRHSYRGSFTEQAVPREDLTRIVEAGLSAPSGCNAQTTFFVIVDDPVIVQAIGGMRDLPVMRTARAFIACVVDKDPQQVYKGHSFQVEDCAAAVENMLLAVTAMGYAAVWIDGWLRLDDNAARIGALLGVSGDKVVRVILPIGVPAERMVSPSKKTFGQRVWFNCHSDKH